MQAYYPQHILQRPRVYLNRSSVVLIGVLTWIASENVKEEPQTEIPEVEFSVVDPQKEAAAHILLPIRRSHRVGCTAQPW